MKKLVKHYLVTKLHNLRQQQIITVSISAGALVLVNIAYLIHNFKNYDSVTGLQVLRGALSIGIVCTCLFVMTRSRKQVIRDMPKWYTNLHRYSEWVPDMIGVRGFIEYLDSSFGHQSMNGSAIVKIDFCELVNINQLYGYDSGIDFVRILAMRLRDTVGPETSVAHMIGDTFLLNIPQGADEDVATQICKLRGILHKPILFQGSTLFVSTYCGISIYPTHGTRALELIQCADIALNESKHSAENSMCIYNPNHRSVVQYRLHLVQELNIAYQQKQFELFYQPLFRTDTSELYAFEALLRWRHPTRGLLVPGDFLEILEGLPLMVDVGSWVLEEAAQWARRWGIKVGVNVSARQLHHPDFMSRIRTLVHNGSLVPELTVLELTESLLVRCEDQVMTWMREVRDMGITLVLDDFGTGYSSFGYLAKFPIKSIKISRSFTQDIYEGHKPRAIVQSIVDLAHLLQIRIVIEGIETIDQMNWAQSLGCDYIQGYLLGTPMCVTGAENLVGRLYSPDDVRNFEDKEANPVKLCGVSEVM